MNPITITIYSVHTDTDAGDDMELFTEEQAEREYCSRLIRESGDQQAIALLDTDLSEAWCVFAEEASLRNDYYARHETDVELSPALVERIVSQCTQEK